MQVQVQARILSACRRPSLLHLPRHQLSQPLQPLQYYLNAHLHSTRQPQVQAHMAHLHTTLPIAAPSVDSDPRMAASAQPMVPRTVPHTLDMAE